MAPSYSLVRPYYMRVSHAFVTYRLVGWTKLDIPHARIMHDNHHLQSTEDSPPSVLEINLRIHAMRAYHTVRTIGVTNETCSFSRKRRERKTVVLLRVEDMLRTSLSAGRRRATLIRQAAPSPRAKAAIGWRGAVAVVWHTVWAAPMHGSP